MVTAIPEITSGFNFSNCPSKINSIRPQPLLSSCLWRFPNSFKKLSPEEVKWRQRDRTILLSAACKEHTSSLRHHSQQYILYDSSPNSMNLENKNSPWSSLCLYSLWWSHSFEILSPLQQIFLVNSDLHAKTMFRLNFYPNNMGRLTLASH